MSEIDLNSLPIEIEEVEKTRIITNGLILEAFSNFLEKIKPMVDIGIDDIYVALNLKEGKYSKQLVKQASEYSLLNVDEKENFVVINDLDPNLLKEVFDDKISNIMKVFEAPVKIIKLLVKDGIKNSQPVDLFDEFLDLLSLATKHDKSRLFMSDFTVWVEFFSRIFIKQQGAMGKSFFIVQAIEKLTSSIPILSFMKTENLNIMRRKLGL
jgi:hypothetical protein